jgi:low temperature requirement protein LtrA
MRGIVLPDAEDDFTADPVELFFDLAYVFAFSQLAYILVHDPTWNGVGEFALLFVLVWLPWTQFTWSANAVSGNARPVRVLFLIATVASIPMAGSLRGALHGEGSETFAISMSIILAMGLFTMVVGLPDDSPVRRSILRYSVPNLVAIAVIVFGSFLPVELMIGLWLVAICIIVAGTLMAGGSEWIIRPGHFAERHGLIVIVALGELVVAIGIAVVDSLAEDAALPTRTLAALVAGGAFAGLMWWSYFDRPLRALEHRHHQHADDGISSGRFARDVYTYGHLPIVAGLILVAAALEEVSLHPGDALPDEFRWMLAGGIVAFLGGIGIAVHRAYGVFARERIIGGALVVALVAAAGSMDALVLLVAVNLLLGLVLVVEHFRVERPYRNEG